MELLTSANVDFIRAVEASWSRADPNASEYGQSTPITLSRGIKVRSIRLVFRLDF
ncbi:hypothetical protein PROFUN_13938 [Planoprotostelium fungivorum]|uniref:Uncharacterized protein n=1 Tax=Planoprotostelium fungivorum TaxID=1890364 RepID=A0A2P6N2F6_9EUKA|nr:hypothetical protein PROFUN_13938 [Planoprotostelium fungivorum]